jgi:type IV fimbrial biogenesis protein FimT
MNETDTSQSGFTLAELLVTMGIGALLLSVGVPAFTTVVMNSNQIGSANEFLSSMHLARDLAITRNVRVTMCPSDNGASCAAVAWHEGWIVFVDTDANGQVDAGEAVGRVVTQIEVPSITTAQFGNALIFRPNGRAMAGTVANNTGELTFCDQRGSAHARVAIVDMSGRPRISRKRMDGSAPVCPSVI